MVDQRRWFIAVKAKGTEVVYPSNKQRHWLTVSSGKIYPEKKSRYHPIRWMSNGQRRWFCGRLARVNPICTKWNGLRSVVVARFRQEPPNPTLRLPVRIGTGESTVMRMLSRAVAEISVCSKRVFLFPSDGPGCLWDSCLSENLSPTWEQQKIPYQSS